ncbi:MAG: proton-conducting transporter membrane subunit [Spirochaetales bacterium]|uniref:Proton-conducting transporter membrane subunit n=1 Tax=Candidatus Thalassospirochaeta sargassi TaxID=3119039 RepID=A0AAJ1I9Y9_9SPIO|nr:proton-conducting transporter membrane subunit [Spirochaetales bacterium]
MILPELIISLNVMIFITGVIIPLGIEKPLNMLKLPLISSIAAMLLSAVYFFCLHNSDPVLFFGGNFIIDKLAFYHIMIVNIVFLAAGIYMQEYFAKSMETDEHTAFHYRRFSMLWQGFQLMLIIVILSNNIGLSWVAMEATTILSAFLIISESDSLSLEAMWKYLLICSVGIGLAFIGTILVAAGGINTFSELYIHAEELNPKLILFAFIFIAVGYGTKAGLSPMHSWLPDAHSQAPTPVSAVFSGVMLNAALFIIMRYLPIVERAGGGSGEAHSILLLTGFLSLLFAAVFIPIQTDLKRLLAYCSVEHVGIIAIGIGLGGLGTTAALLHCLNHSLSKMLAFFASGSVIHEYGTRDMRKITGLMKRMPMWGTAFMVSMLALMGVAPFSIFISEFLIVKTAFTGGQYLLFGLFMLGTLAIFISMLKFTLEIAFKQGKPGKLTGRVGIADKAIIIISVAVLLLFGLWLPPDFFGFLEQAAQIIEGGLI